MAQIIENYCFTLTSGVATWNLFTDLAAAFDWASVSGTNDAKTFTISNHLAIRFDNFESARASGSPSSTGKMYVIVNGNEEQWWTIQGNQLTAARRFRIIIGAAGDLVFQLDTGTNGAVPAAGAGLQFGILNVQSTVDDSVTGYGLYDSRTAGGMGSSNASLTFCNAIPEAFYTDDTLLLIHNTGLQGIANNPNAKITALMPICGLGSECVSTSAFVALISKPDVQQGYVEMEGVLYYAIGGLYLIERASGGE